MVKACRSPPAARLPSSPAEEEGPSDAEEEVEAEVEAEDARLGADAACEVSSTAELPARRPYTTQSSRLDRTAGKATA